MKIRIGIINDENTNGYGGYDISIPEGCIPATNDNKIHVKAEFIATVNFNYAEFDKMKISIKGE